MSIHRFARNAFYLVAATFLSPPKASDPENCFHQHVVQVQIGWGQDWLPYDTCPSSPVSSSGQSARDLRRLTTPKSPWSQTEPQTQSHPRAKSMASDLKADRDSSSLMFLSAGRQHIDDLGDGGSSEAASRIISSPKNSRLRFHNHWGHRPSFLTATGCCTGPSTIRVPTTRFCNKAQASRPQRKSALISDSKHEWQPSPGRETRVLLSALATCPGPALSGSSVAWGDPWNCSSPLAQNMEEWLYVSHCHLTSWIL